MRTLHELRYAMVLAICCLLSLGLSGTATADEPQLLVVQPTSGPPGTVVTVTGTGWSPDYYASGVRISFSQNFGNGVLTNYADDIVVQPKPDGTLSFQATIPSEFKTGDVITFSGLIGNGSGARANFTVGGGGDAAPCPAPQLYITPESGVVGSKFLLKGSGWVPGTSVSIVLPHGSKALLHPEAVTPQVGTGGTAGGWQTGVTVGDSPPGRYEIIVSQPAPQCPSKELRRSAFFLVSGGDTPDIAVTEVNLLKIGKYCAGQSATIRAIIRNSSNSSTGDFNIKWTVWQGSRSGVGQEYLGGHHSIEANGTDSHDHIINDLQAGWYWVNFTADFDGHTKESDEGNNQSSFAMNVLPSSDVGCRG